MDTQAAANDEPATALNEDEKDKWQSEGKSELDKKYYGVFSRSRHGRYQECERILLTDVDGQKVPVDCRDEFENTPLIIAAQNNKKRVASSSCGSVPTSTPSTRTATPASTTAS